MRKIVCYTAEYEEKASLIGADKELCEVFSTNQFIQLLKAVNGEKVELHIFAKAGVYGFYVGQEIYPEQLSREDWLGLDGCLSSDSVIYLHHAYAERWLAPYLANLYGVEVHAVGAGAVFHRELESDDQSYDSSADLYDAAFSDMKVRELEWEYVQSYLQKFTEVKGHKPRLLEIGSGNGQMQRQLLESGLISSGVGLDASQGMVDKAKFRHDQLAELEFKLMKGSDIDLADNSVDVAMSFMSFRYLDWEPLMREIRRVVKPGGFFIMVDMAETVLSEADRRDYLETKARTAKLHQERPDFATNLKLLVEHPEWKAMLKYHPKRLASEYENFLCSRFPKGDWRRLYVSYDHSLFGFYCEL